MYENTEYEHYITNIVKDSKGEIIGYKLENGRILSKNQAVYLAKQGVITGVSVQMSKNGEEFLKSLPDGDINNNLSNLPIIDEEEI